MLNRIFDYLATRVSYGFAVAAFAVFGGQISAALGFLFILFITPLPADRVWLHLGSLGLGVLVAAMIHYSLFGMWWPWRRWALPQIQRLNVWVTGEKIDPDIPTPELSHVTRALETLPVLNRRLAVVLGSVVVLVEVALESLLGTWGSAARFLLGGAVAVVLYSLFITVVTELVTRAVLGQARQMLAAREAWQGPARQTALATKLKQFVMLVAVSLLVVTFLLVLNPDVSRSPWMVFLFSGLTLGIVAFMSALIFHAILRPLQELEEAATHLVTAQRATLFSSSTNREFIALARHFYAAAQRIVEYRMQLQALNRTLERRVAARTAELEAQQQALRESEQRLALHVQHVPLAVIEWDLDFRVVDWNPGAKEIFGYSWEEAVGRYAVDLLVPLGARERVAQIWDAVLEGRGGTHGVNENVTRDGRIIVCEWYNTVLVDGAGHVIGVTSMAQDITERQQAEEALQRHAEELEARNAELDAFAHTVAHDLKNPLSSLIGLSTFLEACFEDMPPQKLGGYVHRITQTGNRMNNIVNELLLLASVRKMEEVETGPLDMDLIVVEAQNRLVDLIAAHQAAVTTPEGWPVAIGYAPWVIEIWVNYISNAVKYGGQAKTGVLPHVMLGYDVQTPAGDDGDERGAAPRVRFWVRDNGPGLSEAEQARLFAPFTRLHQVRAEGHGLGLSIVQRIAAKLGGEVGVESQIGQGSLFYFTLPGASNSAG